MKRILAIALAVVFVAGFAMAATNLLGSRVHPHNNAKWRTTWANPSSTPTGLINTSTATTSYTVKGGCNKAKVTFGSVSGSNIMNVAVQVADRYGPQYGDNPPVQALFTNVVGTSSEPWHQVKPGDTDTHKFDIKDREFEVWRLQCLAGCGVNNTIGLAWGDCWMEGTGTRE